jgi:predicted CoA-substrate-specific enzyme activase
VLADSAELALPLEQRGFSLLARPAGMSGRVYLSPYRRTRGKPLAASKELLEEIISAVGEGAIRGVCFTGSGSKLAAARMGAAVVNEFKAVAAGLAATGVEARTVFEMGGECSKYLRLNRNKDGGGPGYGIVDYATNGDCAAGTGSFIDQQAGRLKLAVEEVGPLVLSAERAAQVAGRCSVFAKSDMVHAQQKGYSPAEVLRGLCTAVARNFRAAVVRSHAVEEPVVFIGGLAANAAVVRAMAEVFGLDQTGLIVPPAFAHVPAVGAAVIASRTEQSVGVSRMNDLRAASDISGLAFPTASPLSMENVLLLRDRVEPYRPPAGGEPIEVYIGIDIGSVSTNVVAIDEDGRVVVDIYTRTMGRPIKVVGEALRQIERDWGDRFVVRGVGTTGSGRELIGELVGADTINDEITAHKTGAMFIGGRMLGGRVPDTIFEIGGQDSKYISLQDGIVVDFTMNEACAAGTGSFLEERAEELDIAIEGEFAELALSSKAPIRLGERCTVFMERDVNSYLQRGAEKVDLVAGLAYSVVYNYINRIVRGRKIGDCIFFQGGTAYNDSVAAAFAGLLGKEIIVPPHNGVIGAIGAALLARDKMAAGAEAQEEPPRDAAGGGQDAPLGRYVSEIRQGLSRPSKRIRSRFRGYDVSKIDYTLREFTCRGCSNACQIQEFNVEGQKTYWGDKCSDRYRKRAKATARPVIEDLFALRTKLLMDESDLPPAGERAMAVGLPLTMFAVETLPFWRAFLAGCGFRVVLSTATNKQIVQAGLDTVVAEPCFPIIAAHGHVADLLGRGVDRIFLPNIVSTETRWMDTESYLCPWHQTLPFVCRQVPAFQPHAVRFISPTLHFREGPKVVCRELQEALAHLGVRGSTVERALHAALETQGRFKSAVLAAGQRAIRMLESARATGIVLVGRPYNIHDAGMNLSIAGKLREYYGVNCIPLDFLDTDPVDIRDVNENMYWDLGRRIIAVAKIVSRHPNLHIIYITNFKCGPDSFVKHFIRRSSGKPFLSLQFDGHSNDAGMMTRCEAYLDSKGILRPWRKEPRAAQKVF